MAMQTAYGLLGITFCYYSAIISIFFFWFWRRMGRRQRRAGPRDPASVPNVATTRWTTYGRATSATVAGSPVPVYAVVWWTSAEALPNSRYNLSFDFLLVANFILHTGSKSI